jgi:DNA (cytosine-5)-methyltransferase 1
MRVLSLFSGAGGLDLGFKMAGHEIIWANDNYPDAVETYRRNIGQHIVLKNISEIPSEDIPSGDIVIGGFPCQGFSVANVSRNSSDSRNKLYLEMLRIIKDKEPRYFLAENVKGILSLDRGSIIKLIASDFESVGYDVKVSLLNAADYGVPQKRERVFIMGIRKGLKNRITFPPPPTHSAPELASILGLNPWVTIGEALKEIPAPEHNSAVLNNSCSKYKLRFNNYLGHRWVDANKPAPTITARGDERGGVVVIHHPSNQRRMTARELASAQSFPVNYGFYGSQTSAYRQIANAVPPILASRIAEQFPA